MYFEDLTSYEYVKIPEKSFNVGWLDDKHEFTKGEPPLGFVEKLEQYKHHTAMLTKGFHMCQFCSDDVPKKSYSSNEIRVVSSEGKLYASPTMIIHYVKEHNYLPPQEFIDAVMNGPYPGSPEYLTMRNANLIILKEHDIVVLTVDMPDDGLSIGDRGAVVHLYPGRRSFEAEFEKNGKTIVSTLNIEQIQKA